MHFLMSGYIDFRHREGYCARECVRGINIWTTDCRSWYCQILAVPPRSFCLFHLILMEVEQPPLVLFGSCLSPGVHFPLSQCILLWLRTIYRGSARFSGSIKLTKTACTAHHGKHTHTQRTLLPFCLQRALCAYFSLEWNLRNVFQSFWVDESCRRRLLNSMSRFCVGVWTEIWYVCAELAIKSCNSVRCQCQQFIWKTGCHAQWK
jgi:hypothetical protein